MPMVILLILIDIMIFHKKDFINEAQFNKYIHNYFNIFSLYIHHQIQVYYKANHL